MTRALFFQPSDWDSIRLVIFDVDGTLYNQQMLRLRMVRDILLHTLRERDFTIISVLRSYRRLREQFAEEEKPDFEVALLAETAGAVGCTPEMVRSIITQWIEQRPLPYLAACRYPGLIDLFAGLRRNQKCVGILSDYPARKKLDALGLTADYIVSSGDEEIGLLKPHTRGLENLIAAAGVGVEATILIGDRVERDGLVAQRMGVKPLIRSSRPINGWKTFESYNDPIFTSLLAL